MQMSTHTGPSAIAFQTEARAQRSHPIQDHRLKVSDVKEVVVRGHSLETVQVSQVLDQGVNGT